MIYHLEWLGRQPGTMMLGVKFDTETKPGVTQIVIEIGFEQGEDAMKVRAQRWPWQVRQTRCHHL